MYQIRCPLREAGAVGNNQVGLICPEGRLTFYEYDQAVSATAQALRAAGVPRHARLGLAVAPGWQQPILFFAALRAGAVACFTPSDATGEALAADLNAIACRYAVTDAPSRASRNEGAHYFRTSDVIQLILPTSEDGLDFVFESNRPATITFTGGPDTRRALLHSYGSFYYGALGSNVNMDLRTNDRWLIGSSLSDMQSLSAVFRCAVSGATLVVPAPNASLADNIIASCATHAQVGVRDLEMLLGGGRMSASRLKIALVRERLSDELWRETKRAGIRVQMCYTIPEMASQVTAMTRVSPPAKQQTSGTAMRYCEVRIAADGHIQVRGRALFDGYVRGEQVVPAADAEGWFTTCDYGTLDADGYLTLGR